MAGDLRSRMNKTDKHAQKIISENPEQAKKVEDVMKRYKGKSENELMQELQRAAARGKASGEITNEKIDKLARQVMPMIDRNQQQKMQSLLNMLKKQ